MYMDTLSCRVDRNNWVISGGSFDKPRNRIVITSSIIRMNKQTNEEICKLMKR